MPQVDLETLVSVCAGGSSDRKIACETLAATDDQPDHLPEQPESVPSDFPPESFCLSKDDELEWFDRNAFYERKESQKGNSNSNSTNLNPSSNSGSQRFALKSKASILGLPKPQKAYVDTKNRRNCKPANARLFPKRSGSVGKTDPPLAEPSSPKVSCMGRVRSKRDKNKRMKDRQKSENRQTSGEKPVGRGKSGFLASFRAIFWTGCKEASARESKSLPAESPRKRKSAAINNHDIRSRLPPDDVDAIPAESPPRKSEARQSLDCEPVGLGGMKRFASGRKSDSWLDADGA